VNCRKVTDLLPLYVGGDLPERDDAAVEAHLDGCGSCRAELDRYEESRQSLFALKGATEGPAPDLWEDIRKRLPDRPPRVRRIPWAAAAAVLLVAGGALAWTALRPAGSEPARKPPGVATSDDWSVKDGGSAPEDPPVRVGAGGSEFVLAEVGPAAASRGFDSLPSVRPVEDDRKVWDEF
jgi:anti-sigma factor RsiW